MSSLLTNDNVDDREDFTRRALIVGIAQGGLLAVLGTRLGWLQLAEGQHYQMLSDKNRIDLKMIAPKRGEIYDRNGTILAMNEQNFRALITPEQAASPEIALKKLGEVITLSERDIETALNNIKRVAKFTSVEVKDQLSWEDLAKIEVRINDLPGISTDTGLIREYPLDKATAHIIGYVGAPTQDDLRKDRLFTLPGFKVGKTALERHFDKKLRGEAGLMQVEVNVTGREVHELKRQNDTPGDTLHLTIDAPLQSFLQERLSQETSCSATIMDAHSGAIYAMASHPSFDPNLFVKGMPTKTWDNLLKMRGNPLTNKAVAGQYPPGSTFKMITALAALKHGVTTQNKTVYCPGHYDLGQQRFHCWKHAGHGHVNLEQALAQSCDTYFYELANEIGIDKIAAMARLFGLGQSFDHILPEARAGIVPDKNWKMGHMGQTWRPGDTIVSSIGQGSLLSTPLQLAVMTARMVNGGKAVEPYLVEPPADTPAPKWDTLPIKAEHLALVQKGMNSTVNHDDGTAYASRIENPDMAMAGKTGTSQVKRITMAQRAAGVKNEDLPWEQRHHALFVGYAPVHSPRYVCSVVVEHGVGGSRTAAPIARDILEKAQIIAPHLSNKTERPS